MSIKPEIAELFSERFPRYAFLLPNWEELEVPASLPLRSDWSAALPLEHVDVLYLYGMGEGAAAMPLLSWLKEKQKRRLIFLEPSEARLAQFLRTPQAEKILQNEQIDLYHLPSGREKSALIQELVEKHPVRGTFVANPSGQEPQRFARLKLQLLRKIALTHANFIDRLYSHIPLSNLLKNLPHLPEAFYVNGMKDAFKGVPAILCGAGPSLQSSIETIRSLENRALIFAGGSAISALSSKGIIPHFAAAIDPNHDELMRLKNSFAFEVPFLFSSRLFPDSLATCNGPFGYIRSGMSGICELWFEEELGLTETILGEDLPSESLSVTTLCAAIAHHFGCNPILFDGLDLAYTDNRRYAEGVLAAETETKENLQPVDRLLQKKDRRGKTVTSAVRWVMESSALSEYARRCKTRRWINCTRGGIGLEGVETLSIEEAAEQLVQERDLRSLVHAATTRSPMPEKSAEILPAKVNEMKASLDAMLGHLEILVKNESRGLCALAELELKDELAYAILFFDCEKTLRAALNHGPTQTPEERVAFWKALQELALNCKTAFQ